MEYADIVIVLALFQYFYFAIQVGSARGQNKIPAPKITGNDEFERRFRVQQNTMEQLIVFVPAMFLFSYYLNPVWAAILGLIFIIGRFIYAAGYIKDPSKRGPGMMITLLSNVILMMGALIGAVMNII